MEKRVLITQQSLKRIASQKKLPAGVVEKSYVIAWLLKEIYQNETLKEALVFKGGTALNVVYFPETWRLSHDIDFTRVKDVDAEELRRGFADVFSSLVANSGIRVLFDSYHVTVGSIVARVQFIGPLDFKNSLKLDVTFDEKLLHEPVWRRVSSVYPDLVSFDVNVYPLNEILIEKIRSIIQRGRSRDYYDVWRLLKVKDVEMGAVERQLIEKCQINDVPYRPDLIFNYDRLKEAGSYWEKSLNVLTKELPKFEDVISELKVRLSFSFKDGENRILL